VLGTRRLRLLHKARARSEGICHPTTANGRIRLVACCQLWLARTSGRSLTEPNWGCSRPVWASVAAVAAKAAPRLHSPAGRCLMSTRCPCFRPTQSPSTAPLSTTHRVQSAPCKALELLGMLNRVLRRGRAMVDLPARVVSPSASTRCHFACSTQSDTKHLPARQPPASAHLEWAAAL
jgi:hypothetical protein